MLDIRVIRQNPDLVRAAIHDKHDNADLDGILALDQKLRDNIPRQEALRAERKALAKTFKGPPPAEAREKLEALKDQDRVLEEERGQLERELAERLLYVPNVPHESVPAGTGSADNVVVHARGPEPSFDFAPKPHWEIGQALGILDIGLGAALTGSGWVVLRGAGAALSRALVDFFLDLHTREHGYREIFAPVAVNRKTLTHTGQLPKFEHQMFHDTESDLFFIPTAEATLTSLHAGEILNARALPLSYTAYSECFRREAGAAGLGTRGLNRLHEFSKVELFKITADDASYDALEQLTRDAEVALDRLGLRWRRTLLCRGDLGISSAKTYDLEVWCPGQNEWIEISSCSNFEAYQARRADIRYRDADGRVHHAHTLNGSGLPVGRTLAAILETFQTADGRVRVPEALRARLGTEFLVKEA